jgi:protein-disulfide isomerase
VAAARCAADDDFQSPTGEQEVEGTKIMRVTNFARVVALTTLAVVATSHVGFLAAQSGPDVGTPLLPPRGESSAPIVVLLFSDFECPYCARVEPVLDEVRKAFAGQVQVVFKHTPLPIHPRAPLAHEAAIEAGRQGRFWEMHDLLFADQQRLEKADLIARAEKLELDIQAFSAALEDGRHKAAVARDVAEGRALGVTGTPTLFVNGQRLVGVPAAPQLIAYIRSVLSGTATTDAEPRFDVSTLDLAGAPTRGPADAPVTIIEFSDFQCPFCGRATSTIENVWKNYGGKVRWVFKHFPLDFHPDAPLAHRAALAAGEQGKFWEMHDAIFANQRAMKRDDLIRHATSLGLDMTRFVSDLDDVRFDRVVKRDTVEGMRAGISGTPTFFINGERLVGAQPFEKFTAIIDRELGTRATNTAFVRPAAGEFVPPESLDQVMSMGALDAPVTIRWFADFGSRLHKDAVALLKQVIAAHPTDVRVVFSHRPLEGREESMFLHEATLAAAEQGKFWEVHDLLVARPLQNKETLTNNVTRLGLVRDWFEEAISTGRARAALVRHLAEAKELDVRGTPTFLVNGTRIDGIVSLDVMEGEIGKARSAVKNPR